MDLGVSKQMNFSVTQNYSKTGYLESRDHTQLFYRHYSVPNPKATILIIHGFGEHSGRYSHVIDQLLSAHFDVFCVDLRGHGYSKGSRGDVGVFQHYEDDVEALIEYAKSHYSDDHKFFILAHSMGALVTLGLMARTRHKIAGLVLSSPLFALTLPVPFWKKHLGGIIAKLAPKLPIKSEIGGVQLSSDQSFAAAYDSDPLVLKSLSIRAFGQILRRLENSKNLAADIKQPFLMQVAGNDLVVDSGAASAWFKAVNGLAPDRTLKIYQDFLHEIYNESRRIEPISDAVEWFNRRV
jgi:alpha-beta hydrolase superfamily lysophospholipase